LAQTWRPIEIVAVDDCSTDGTYELLERLADQHPELRVFSNSVNGGVAVSRNRILDEALGEFIVFFDDDDESLPERITAQYTRITDYEHTFAKGDPVICHTARKLIYPHGEERIEPTMGQIEGKPAPNGSAVAQRILLGTPLEDAYGACPTCSQMARLSTYRLLGGFDARFRRGEDTELNIRLAEVGGHFVGIAAPLVTQTMTKTSEKSVAEELRNMLAIMEKHKTIMEKEGQYSFCRSWINAKHFWLRGQRIEFVMRILALMVRHPALTSRRMVLSLPNLGLNKAFGRFHKNNTSSQSR
jgi:glycosyltransferase involved in cell wall biosynthesis